MINISKFISFILYFIKNYKNICKIPFKGKDKLDKSNKIYFDSFSYYFKTFSGEMNSEYSEIEILYEIIIIILGIITFFLNKYFSILVIKYLTPAHLIFSSPIFFYLQKMILMIINLIKNGKFSISSSINFIVYKFVLDISGDFFSFIGFLIYFEIIELNCGKYNYNTKKNIERRSYGESYGINNNSNNNTLINGEEEEEEEEEEGEREENENENGNENDQSPDFTLN